MLLTPKREAFALAVAAGNSQSDAYRQAFNATKMKASTINQAACRLMADSNVAARVQELQLRAVEANGITVDRIVKELALVAFGRKKDLMRWGPGGLRLIDSDELTDDAAAQVSEVRETVGKEGGSLSVKTHDKVKALELLGRYKGMFKEKVELTGPGGSPVPVASVTANLTEMDATRAAKAYSTFMEGGK